jgi:hypothetical protein
MACFAPKRSCINVLAMEQSSALPQHCLKVERDPASEVMHIEIRGQGSVEAGRVVSW